MQTNSQLIAISEDTRKKILGDLEYWREKKAHFEKVRNHEGVKVAKLLLNRYLDKYNEAIL